MPTTYAHWAFGRECIDLMPQNLQKIIHENRDIYNLGVHGPDIFFYDLLHSDVAKYGSELHNIPVNVFFKNCKQVFKTHPEKAQMLAYMMGFLSHFVLDSQAHSYVQIKDESCPASHNLIEAQWDRHLIELDNRKVNLVDRAESLKPNNKNAKIISYFYPYDKKTVLRTCRMQKFVVSTLNCISKRKQDFLQNILLKLNQNDFADLFVGFEENEYCRDSNMRLDKIGAKAMRLYPKLMKNLINYLNDDAELDEYFDHDFCEWPDYTKIPVLAYKQELVYNVR